MMLRTTRESYLRIFLYGATLPNSELVTSQKIKYPKRSVKISSLTLRKAQNCSDIFIKINITTPTKLTVRIKAVSAEPERQTADGEHELPRPRLSKSVYDKILTLGARVIVTLTHPPEIFISKFSLQF